jgi:MoaA/NifB/PqqE/SkfB family radical SAM enzyme
MTLDEALSYIDEAVSVGAIHFGISGGEPFLCYDNLVSIVDSASRKGLRVNCTTNAFWATTMKDATSMLSILSERGLKSLGISVDDFHQEFVPIRHVAHAVMAAKKVNIEEISLSCTTTSTNNGIKHYYFYLTLLGVDLSGINLLETVRMPIGRRSDSFPVDDYKCIEEFPENASLDFCFKKVLIDPVGKVFPCCNYFIAPTGSLTSSSLGDILTAMNENAYIQLLKNHGPVYLLHHLVEEGLIHHKKGGYADLCHICAYICSFTEVRDLFWC